MGLQERLAAQRAAEAAAAGKGLPSEYYADGTRKPEWVIRADRRQLPAQVDGAPGDNSNNRPSGH